MTKRRWQVGVLLLLLVASVWGISRLFGPARGTVTSPSSPHAATTGSGSGALHRGEWFELTSPPGYESRPTSHQAGVKETAEFLARNPSRQLEVAIYDGSLGGDSGVLYRRHNPGLYHEAPLDAGLSGRIFTRTDGGFQGAAYIEHGAELATVALTSYGSDEAGARREFDAVIGSFHWLK